MSAELEAIKVASSQGQRAVHRKAWAIVWPKLMAIGIILIVWEAVFLSGWKPPYLFASPLDTFAELGRTVAEGRFWLAMGTTLLRGVLGFLIALVIGTVLGIVLSQSKLLRSSFGSLISGLLTMPSIVWFPFAILIFGLTQEAIFFVIVIGAAPSIANGIIAGVDDIPPQLLRAGHMIGLRGWNRYRHLVLPAIMPSYVAGLAQGWAFAWRGLMAGELLVVIPGLPSLGSDLYNAGQIGSSAELLGLMIVILLIGMLASAVFSGLAKRVRASRGLTGFSAA